MFTYVKNETSIKSGHFDTLLNHKNLPTGGVLWLTVY